MDGKLPRRRPIPIAICLLLFHAVPALADVLNDHDNSPLTGIFGMPDSTEGALFPPAGTSAWSLSYGVASHSIDEAAGDETLYLDGETSRLELRYRYAPAQRLELGVAVPFIQHDGGHLDSLIDAWHEFFHLPEGKRPSRDQDILDFRYSAGDGSAVELAEPPQIAGDERRIGDVSLFGGWQLSGDSTHSLAVRFGVEFPTGDARSLLGSGGTDISVGLAGDLETWRGSDRWSAFYRLNAIRIGKPEYLAGRYRPWVGQVSAGAGFRLTDGIELRAQAGWRSAIYNSDIHHIGSHSTTLTFGGNIRIREHFHLSIAVGEDIDVSTAPDVSLLLALRYNRRQ